MKEESYLYRIPFFNFFKAVIEMDLLKEFRQYIKQQNLFNLKDKLLVAVSGGVDSVVLCELCKQAGYNFAIAHCNFKLRGADSESDEIFAKALSDKYAVKFFVAQFNTNAIAKSEKKSIEETARHLRYTWFEKLRVTNEYNFVVTAHHANDNIETVLMNFFRGTGIKGLHGILPKQHKVIRPLLFTTKNEIEIFAKNNQLSFVTDYTNAQNDFTRNYFRNELIPAVQKVYPSAADNILKNITRFGEAEQLYNQAIEHHKQKLIELKGNEVHLPVLKLQQTKPLATVLYEIICHYNFTPHQTNDVINLLQSESGKYVQSISHRIIRNRKWLIISPNKTIEAQNILIEEKDKKIIFEMGELKIENCSHFNIQPSNLIAQLDIADIKFPLLLRKWKQGDYFYPLGMQKLPAGKQGKKKLSRFFIDQKLSLTQKEKIWVIESDKKMLWIVGLRIDNRFKITNATKNILQISFKNADV